ncbi:MAG: 2,3-bisphosphoglycerate-independent phosphoglycerate mutase [Vallitaleaceae bacterium]|nr:2,3-bisphosphoglycerate-independent phosphoglycerate mutase [Vallitaleaceae bacterium]
MNKKPTVLMILDGFGLNKITEGNAIAHAKKPNIDKLFAENPFVEGHASGLDVGLPHGQMGNSEVGHLNIGAGRIVYQELTRVTKSIDDGDFYENPAFLAAIKHCKDNNTSLHLFGLLSDGGVHSHNTHLYALLKLAKQQEIEKVFIHCFLDGRDTSPASGKRFVQELEEKAREIGVGKIATVMGRYYAMDRDNRWERVKLAYDAMVKGEGLQAISAVTAVQSSYDLDKNDEFVLPTIILDEGKITATIQPGDGVIFFNFRPDRARELTRVFCDESFSGFERTFMPLCYVCFNEYDITIKNNLVAFRKDSLANTLGEYLSGKGLKQLRLAETEKYAHVTFFFNGGVEELNSGETRILVASPKVATYDLQPEMSAYKVKDELIKAIESQTYDFIVVNFANPDMVGHTGIEIAAIEAIEVVDKCVGEAIQALLDVDGQMFLCADHGNAEQLIDYETHEPFTAHTINPVPFSLFNAGTGITLMEGGKLADIAPTLLDMMGIEQPKEMTGHSLLQKI